MKKKSVIKRAKWLIAIAVFAILVGFTTKSVISYPEECQSQITA